MVYYTEKSVDWLEVLSYEKIVIYIKSVKILLTAENWQSCKLFAKTVLKSEKNQKLSWNIQIQFLLWIKALFPGMQNLKIFQFVIHWVLVVFWLFHFCICMLGPCVCLCIEVNLSIDVRVLSWGLRQTFLEPTPSLLSCR